MRRTRISSCGTNCLRFRDMNPHLFCFVASAICRRREGAASSALQILTDGSRTRKVLSRGLDVALLGWNPDDGSRTRKVLSRGEWVPWQKEAT